MRIGRLCLVILALALTTASLSAAPHKGGSVVRSKAKAAAAAAGAYWFYCYSDPGVIYDCDGEACDCKAACADTCGGPCDWDDTCID